MRFHSGAGCSGLLRARYPLASLFSSLDVHRNYSARFSRQPVGVFHWDICGWPMELYKPFCDHLLLQRAATACSMGSYRPSGPGRFAYRSACLVFKSACHCRMSLGVFSPSNKISPRPRSFCSHLRPHHRILRSRYGSISTSLSCPLSSNAASASSLVGAHAGGANRPTTRSSITRHLLPPYDTLP